MSQAPWEGIAAEALTLLEWPRLAGHVAGFASTAAGARHCASLPLAASAADSRALLAETTELLGLDGVLEGGLSFRGVADIASTSMEARSCLIFSLCATPNRCSSSMTSSPRSWNFTSSDRMRWVPMSTSTLP